MTIREFAHSMGLSKTTVSKAFSGNGRIAPATREAILRSAQEQGFAFNPHAQRLSTGRSHDLVGLFCPSTGNGATLAKNQRIQTLLEEQGWEVPLYTSGREDGDVGRGQIVALQRLRRLQPRAIVCFTLPLRPAALNELRQFQADGGLLICYDAPVSLDCDQVIFDRVDNTYQTTGHLIAMGHREIGMYAVGEPGWEAAFYTSRIEGFRRALADGGVPERAEWLWSGSDTETDGAELARKFLLLEQRPTALCIVNECVASAFLNEVIRAGVRVPHDISIVSNDDMPVARYAAVPITTITHPLETIAMQTAELVRTRLDNPTQSSRRIVLRGEIVFRESVTCRREGATLQN